MNWELMETRTLVYGGDFEDRGSTIKAKIFEVLVVLSEFRLKSYRSDLFHDALWLDKVAGPEVFCWSVRESGTYLGDEEFINQVNKAFREGWTYKFELVEDNEIWSLRIWEGCGELQTAH